MSQETKAEPQTEIKAPPTRLKIVVYTIAQNEMKFVERWMESMKEADAICVLDTGSTDGTPETLKRLGAKVGVRRYAKWGTLAEYDSAVRAGKSPRERRRANREIASS